MSPKPLNFPQSLRKTSLALAIAATLALPIAALAAPGDPVGSEFRVNTTTADSQNVPSIALDADGDFVVAWSGNGIGDNSGVFVQRYNRSGAAQGGEFRVNTTTANHQFSPSIALDADGDFVVAWTSRDQDGSNDGIYAQRYNKLGAPQGSEFRVNTTTASSQYSPSIAVDADGDFVVAWTSYAQDGDSTGVYAQRYSNLGVEQGREFRVNTTTANSQYGPSIAVDADGDFVVAWESRNQDGDAVTGVYAQRYSNLGVEQGREFRVNTTTDNFQGNPSVALDVDGDFVVAWQSYYRSESYDPNDVSLGIYVQRYNNAGIAQGSEVRVDTTTAQYQSNPSIALDADGDFVVAWNSFYQDGSGYGIYAQRYNRLGVEQGREFRVNTYTSNDQYSLSLGLDADGDFVVAWQSNYQDGSRYGIYAQRYAGTGTVITDTCNGVTATIVGTNGPDILNGTAGNDVIAGLDGNDTINGFGGNDLLCGGLGNDRMLGGTGNDFIRGADGIDTVAFTSTSGVTANLTTGTATGEGSDTLQLIENLSGTAAADRLTGNAFINVLTGAGGNDTLDGAGGFDTATFPGTGPVTVNLSTGTASGIGSDRLLNIEAVTGSSGADRLTGNGVNNTLDGGGGNDIIDGLAGNDRLLGGIGNDTLNGGTGTDFCDGQTGTDTASTCETRLGIP